MWYWLKYFNSILFLVGSCFMVCPATLSATPVLRHVLGIYDSERQKPRLIPENEQPEEHDSRDGEANPVQENLAVVLNHLGYLVEQLDIRNDPLPDLEQMQRYSLVVSWFKSNSLVPQPEEYVRWVENQVAHGRKFLLLGYPGIVGDTPNFVALKKRLYRTLEIEYGHRFQSKVNRIQLVKKDSRMVEFEHHLTRPFPWYDLFRPLNPQIKSYLRVKYLLEKNSESDMVMIGPKGGMIAPGYALFREPGLPYRRKWKVHPFLFMKTLLNPRFPAPDVTTSGGKRLFYAHIDGDGFRNFSEVSLNKYSSEIIHERFIRKFPQVPIGVSVIVGDIDPEWWGNARLIEIAKKIFSDPHVEAATHTYTHPYQWQRWDRTSAYSPLGSFRYEREIDESIEWIEEHLLPAKKRVEMVYWSGDTTPPEEALIRTVNLGRDHLNGGDTKMDKQFPSYTSVAPLMRPVGNRWQIFTSASNENLYTELWTANFHGFRNVIQTFENTNSPFRLTPVNVYYHFYIGDKVASLRSLQHVYNWVLQQDLNMIFPSEYVQLVRGFISTQLIETEPGVFEIKNRGTLNTFRLDYGQVDLDRSHGVQGVHQINQSFYIDLAPDVPIPRIAIKTTK